MPPCGIGAAGCVLSGSGGASAAALRPASSSVLAASPSAGGAAAGRELGSRPAVPEKPAVRPVARPALASGRAAPRPVLPAVPGLAAPRIARSGPAQAFRQTMLPPPAAPVSLPPGLRASGPRFHRRRGLRRRFRHRHLGRHFRGFARRGLRCDLGRLRGRTRLPQFDRRHRPAIGAKDRHAARRRPRGRRDRRVIGHGRLRRAICWRVRLRRLTADCVQSIVVYDDFIGRTGVGLSGSIRPRALPQETGRRQQGRR